MNEKLNNLIKQSLDISRQIKLLESKNKSLKAEVKILMDNDDLKKYEDDEENVVSCYEMRRESLDKKKVKSLLGELQYDTVVKVTTYPVLKILSKESKENIDKMLKSKR